MLEGLPLPEGDVIGDIHLADLYIELGDMEKAVLHFQSGWLRSGKNTGWVNRYIYALMMNGDYNHSDIIVKEMIDKCHKEIGKTENNSDTTWSTEDKNTFISELYSDIENYQTIVKKISSDYLPELDFQTSLQSGCYLFGCTRHGCSEYNK